MGLLSNTVEPIARGENYELVSFFRLLMLTFPFGVFAILYCGIGECGKYPDCQSAIDNLAETVQKQWLRACPNGYVDNGFCVDEGEVGMISFSQNVI